MPDPIPTHYQDARGVHHDVVVRKRDDAWQVLDVSVRATTVIETLTRGRGATRGGGDRLRIRARTAGGPSRTRRRPLVSGPGHDPKIAGGAAVGRPDRAQRDTTGPCALRGRTGRRWLTAALNHVTGGLGLTRHRTPSAPPHERANDRRDRDPPRADPRPTRPGRPGHGAARLGAWTPIEGLLELPREAEELIDAAGAELGHLTANGQRWHAWRCARRPPGGSPGPSPNSPTGSTGPDEHGRERSGRWPGCGSAAIAANATSSRDSQTTHLKARQRMKNVSNAVVAVTTSATRRRAERAPSANAASTAARRAGARRGRTGAKGDPAGAARRRTALAEAKRCSG